MAENSYTDEIGKVQIPYFYKLHQNYVDDRITDVYGEIRKSCIDSGSLAHLKSGMTVALAVGSREYSCMPDVVRATVDAVRSIGAKPFIIPAMGSHGGMTAAGQKDLLRQLGVTEQIVGAPVKSSMETVCIGKSQKGLDVHIDKLAFEADKIVPINRIKAHTDFRGKYESGLVKMMAIGIGKQHGASICHAQGFGKMAENIYLFGKRILETGKIAFGVGVIENESHSICRAVAIPYDKILEEEPSLLIYAKSRMPSFPFKKADLLFVDQIGKDFSGTGMDANVIGRSPAMGSWEPNFERIVIFDLTEKSHGNGNGMGLADITTKHFIEKVDFYSTYVNGITASFPDPGKMPVVMPTEYNAYCYGIKACTRHGDGPIRIAHIKNTMSVSEMFVSEALARDMQDITGVTIDGQKYLPVFDDAGTLKGYSCA